MSAWFADRIDISFEQDSRGVRAVQSSSGWLNFANVVVRYDVAVPRAWKGKIDLQTSNGRITARELRGEANLRTSNGTIEVVGQSGGLEARTSNGPIVLRNVEGIVAVQTSNGSIRVEDATLSNSGRFRTSNGTIDLHAKLVDDASYEVRTSNGRVGVVLVEPDVAVELRTSNGRIDLDAEMVVSEVSRSNVSGRIGEGKARLDVRTSNGNVTLTAK